MWSVVVGGGRLFAGDDKGKVHRWDMTASPPRRLTPLTGHTNWVHALAFASDGRPLASGGDDATVRLWDLEGEKPRPVNTCPGHVGPLWGLAFGPDDSMLVSGSYTGRAARLWDLSRGLPRESLALQHATKSAPLVAFSPDGRTVATGSAGLRLIDVATRKEVRTISAHKDDQIGAMVFAPDGRTLVTGGADGAARVLDVTTGDKLEELPHAGWVNSVAVSPDGRLLLTGSGNTDNKRDPPRVDCLVRFWDLKTGNLLRTFEGHPTQLSSVAFSPDGRFAISGCVGGALRVWDLKSPDSGNARVLRSGERHGLIRQVSVLPDGKTQLVLELEALTVRTLQPNGPEVSVRLPEQAMSLAVSCDGRYAAVGLQTGMIWIIRVPPV